ncbi:MAG: metal-dependent transcriptional regulator [Desulfobulbaceae bacterium]|nr:metal-dependent transcriptional regulator [Desulfobulbaceae bacterium]HIJ78722.1 metal-dependent transcriptional regulator [Deltaproteobacteria bacterium]
MKKTKHLSASLEDYLETIYHIISEKQVARAKEIAGKLKVSRSSVTEAFRSLAQKGLINYAPYEVITMTPEGKKAAEDVIRRHQALKVFFIKVLAVDEKTAEGGACRIEHAAPREIIDRLTQFVNFLEECPHEGGNLIKSFKDYCSSGIIT